MSAENCTYNEIFMYYSSLGRGGLAPGAARAEARSASSAGSRTLLREGAFRPVATLVDPLQPFGDGVLKLADPLLFLSVFRIHDGPLPGRGRRWWKVDAVRRLTARLS